MFVMHLDLSPLLSVGMHLDEEAKKAMKQAGHRLTVMTKAHIQEEAAKKLHTRRQMFLDGLSHFQLNDDTFVVNLDAKVRWIDDGMPPHNMIDDLLKSKSAKRAKDGSKYVVVPFKHNKGPTQLTPAQKTLRDTVERELKKANIPYGKLEKGSDGRNKLGLLHKVDINHAPIKTANVPGQGKGPIGKVMQGPTGIPLLQGLRVYQHETKNPDGSFSDKRMIMTFRVASSKHKGQGRWDHPGTEAVKLMDEAYDWARRTWDSEIVPQVTMQLTQSL